MLLSLQISSACGMPCAGWGPAEDDPALPGGPGHEILGLAALKRRRRGQAARAQPAVAAAEQLPVAEAPCTGATQQPGAQASAFGGPGHSAPVSGSGGSQPTGADEGSNQSTNHSNFAGPEELVRELEQLVGEALAVQQGDEAMQPEQGPDGEALATGADAEGRGPDDQRAPQLAPPCHLHRKMKETCKFCQRFKQQARAEGARAHTQVCEAAPGPLESEVAEVCNTETFNFTPILRMQICRSTYFKTLLAKSLDDILDDIHTFVDHIEPYQDHSLTDPSTLFCCVYRLLMRRLTRDELRGFLQRERSPYIRAAGFLYIRYGWDCNDVWQVCEEYLFDTEEFRPRASAELRKCTTTIGGWLESLLVDERYYGTTLPRMAHALKKEMALTLMQVKSLRAVYQANAEHLHAFHKGALVDVLLRDRWAAGEIVALRDEQPHRLRCVVLVEGRNVKTSLGMLRLRERGQGGNRPRSRSASSSRSRSRSRSPMRPQDLSSGSHEAFLRREREKATVQPWKRCCPRTVRGHRYSLMGKVKQMTPAAAFDTSHAPKPSRTAAADEKAAVTDNAAADEQVRSAEAVAERKRCLLEILQKYAPSGVARQSRVEYHELSAGAVGPGCQKLDLGDTPDVLRLG